MLLPVLIPFLLSVAAPPVVVERIAVIVGDRVIKTSDIDREVRMTEFLNGDPLELSAAARKKAAERLIDQTLIRRELEVGGYGEAGAQETAAMLKQVKAQRFGGSETRYRAALEQYGIRADQLEKHVRWQLTVLKFIDQRFRPGVLVTDDDIRAYLAQHPLTRVSTAEARKRAEDEIAAERVNQQFYAWLEDARKRAAPEYKQGALQ